MCIRDRYSLGITAIAPNSENLFLTESQFSKLKSRFKRIIAVSYTHLDVYKRQSRTLQARKKYIYNHPKKIELTNLILEHRQDKKWILVASATAVGQ